MFKRFASLATIFAIALFFVACNILPTATDVSEETGKTEMTQAVAKTAPGFDEFGYNYQARLFNGPADGIDKILDGKVWGDPFYAKDHLVMKWSKAWDDAKFNGAPWTPDAWEDNEWNGKVPGGSGEIWHYKIIWVGSELKNSQYWRDGGYAVWGQFEVILSQGSVNGKHIWETHANPAGYGASK
jgi:hypothetical protein